MEVLYVDLLDIVVPSHLYWITIFIEHGLDILSSSVIIVEPSHDLDSLHPLRLDADRNVEELLVKANLLRLWIDFSLNHELGIVLMCSHALLLRRLFDVK